MFKELLLILRAHGVTWCVVLSYHMKGKIYRACVQCVDTYTEVVRHGRDGLVIRNVKVGMIVETWRWWGRRVGAGPWAGRLEEILKDEIEELFL